MDDQETKTTVNGSFIFAAAADWGYLREWPNVRRGFTIC